MFTHSYTIVIVEKNTHWRLKPSELRAEMPFNFFVLCWMHLSAVGREEIAPPLNYIWPSHCVELGWALNTCSLRSCPSQLRPLGPSCHVICMQEASAKLITFPAAKSCGSCQRHSASCDQDNLFTLKKWGPHEAFKSSGADLLIKQGERELCSP